MLCVRVKSRPAAFLVTWLYVPSNCLPLRPCTLNHAISGVHVTPSLTVTRPLLTNVSNFGVWLRCEFELRQRFSTYRLCWCVGAEFTEKVSSTGKACYLNSGVFPFRVLVEREDFHDFTQFPLSTFHHIILSETVIVYLLFLLLHNSLSANYWTRCSVCYWPWHCINYKWRNINLLMS